MKIKTTLAAFASLWVIAASTSALAQSDTTQCAASQSAEQNDRSSAAAGLRRIAGVQTASGVRPITAASGASQGFENARAYADCLSQVYQRGAGRHQLAIDAGSGAVVFNAAGALLSGGSQAAQRNFGYAAFVPVVAAQLLANEPSRDLYVGGYLALDRITARYVALSDASAILGSQQRNTVASCDQTNALWVRLTSLPTDEAQAAMLADARKFLEQCHAMRRFDQEFAIFHDQVSRIQINLGRDYADDVVKLNDLLYQRHRDVRSNPSETLTTVLAAPFRAADRILTGNDGQAAVDRLKTQNAFQGLEYKLRTYALTRPSTSISDIVAMSDASRRLTPTDKTAKEFKDLLELEGNLAGMRATRLANLNYIDSVMGLSAANALMVEYDGVTRLITVRIEQPRTAPVIAPVAATPAS